MERSWRKLSQLCRVDLASLEEEGQAVHKVNPRLTLWKLTERESLPRKGLAQKVNLGLTL